MIRESSDPTLGIVQAPISLLASLFFRSYLTQSGYTQVDIINLHTKTTIPFFKKINEYCK